jgi:alpha-glutamyl/putrescinyl thymine pyrophosphorylase clade 1
MVYNQNSTGSREIKLARGSTLKASPVFDSYWKFACKRREIELKRLAGDPPPWADDPVLAKHRFTNVYRASDRVSQYLIKNVIYEGRQTAQEIFFAPYYSRSSTRLRHGKLSRRSLVRSHGRRSSSTSMHPSWIQ